ncbi:hypothetical protein LEN26_005341 [Aphanomyces euteiches]|nr:hypothetical protein AeMF1_010893 [Aphanomyces euteiches]KAH9119229.1 hypothetical protein LEN26_011740 [Aphanomyces euteiches]KAH9119719.1 hypothetical protein LEN26_011458 [Aphanomyces euteiches]KAH9122140.1 hypothetical protein LEN26_010360 [Aphanomyces euteiches]KAH9138478.1 hypothetical protein LEN26_005341 [Aphanomyces euteiches]
MQSMVTRCLASLQSVSAVPTTTLQEFVVTSPAASKRSSAITPNLRTQTEPNTLPTGVILVVNTLFFYGVRRVWARAVAVGKDAMNDERLWLFKICLRP